MKFLFFRQTLLNCTNNNNTSSKNFNIFFSYAFFGVRQAEFWLVQSNLKPLWSYYNKNNASGTPKTRYFTHYHILIRLAKSAHLITRRTHPISSSKRSKNVKKQEKSVISVITQKSVLSGLSQIMVLWAGCVPVSYQLETLRSTNGAVVPMLHAVQAWR